MSFDLSISTGEMALKATLSPIRSCCRMYLPVPRVHHRGIRSLTSQLPSSMYTKCMSSSLPRPSSQKIDSFPRSSFPQTILRQFMINTEATPNPDSMKFFPNGQKVLESGTMDFPDLKSTKSSPLAAVLSFIVRFQWVLTRRSFYSAKQA